MKTWIVLLAASMLVLNAADEWKLPASEPKLRAGAGAEVAAANCVLCHSVDYISTQPPLSQAAWLATVNKMRDKYGAPLPTNQIERLVNYLTDTYGVKSSVK